MLLLTACGARAPQGTSTDIAYAGPASLTLRKDIAPKSGAAGTAAHGEKLDVLETRRRFVKVRTAQGVVGWTDSNLLLSPKQMDDLQRLAETVAKLPSEGRATAYDTLNMHAEPSRQSPSFFQIPESGSVEVIGHRATPRIAPVAAAPVHRAKASAAKKTKGKATKRSGPTPPMPLPPAPPSNWRELSRPRADELPGYSPPESKPVPLDDWSLVRSKDGKAGWVLSRMLYMAIPDEVAQYAEGHRITAYLPLGTVKDKASGEEKDNWLWTTASGGAVPYEFDSFRVFVWSLNHHRYETAYIERNVKGYFPVVVEDQPGEDDKAFSLVTEDRDGKIYRRTYVFSVNRVHLVSKAPYDLPPVQPEAHASRDFEPPSAPAPAEIGWKGKLRALLGRVFRR